MTRTIHVCPDCGHVQSHGGRCRNRQAHALDDRVLMAAVEVVDKRDYDVLATERDRYLAGLRRIMRNGDRGAWGIAEDAVSQ